MANLNIEPLGERVAVKRIQAEAVTPGGIILPDKAQEAPKFGVVKAVGLGRVLDDGTRVPTQLKLGDKVVFSTYAGTEINVNGDEYLIMDESDVLGVLR